LAYLPMEVWCRALRLSETMAGDNKPSPSAQLALNGELIADC